MLEDLRGYVQLATGVTEMTTARAREFLNGLVSSEVDRALSRIRFAREEDLVALRRQVDRLSAEVAAMRGAERPVKKAAAKPKKKRVVPKDPG